MKCENIIHKHSVNHLSSVKEIYRNQGKRKHIFTTVLYLQIFEILALGEKDFHVTFYITNSGDVLRTVSYALYDSY